MKPSAHALLEGLIDYAGLFPPAKLPMAEATKEYARIRRGPMGWMLSRFLCPLSRLEEARGLIAEEWPLGVLATRDDDAPELLRSIDRELGLLGDRTAEVLEVPYPESLHASADADAFLDGLARRLSGDPKAPKGVFFELGFVEGWPEKLRTAAGHLADRHRRRASVRFAMKVRTGSADPRAVPDADRVAGFILIADDAGVPWKATAGLHRPVRSGGQHGFLNVFSAGVLMRYHKIVPEDLRDLIREEDATAFRFDDHGLSWRSFHASVDQIRRARKTFAISFGSCSFTEPWEHLHALGLLDSGPGA